MFVVGAQGFRIFLLFASLVILSRLLSPEDFGLYACLTPIIGFISLFQDLGLQQAVVQRAEITDDQLNRIFWIVSAVGVICAIGLCLVSPLIVWFYHEPRLLWLSVAASASLIFTSLASLPSSLLNRTMRFKALATIDVAANLLGFIAAVVGALLGLNYWALIMTPLLVALVTASGSFFASRWRPSRPRLTIGRDILGFGANLTGFNFVNFFSRNLDNILIGRYSGAQDLGFYDRAYKLLMFPLISLNYPLSRVVIPILSRMQHDKERVRRTYLRIVGLLTLATVPGMAAALAVPHDVILLLFGEKWLPVVPIFCWLGLAGLVQPLNSTSGWLFVSQGQAKDMFRWGLFASSTTIIAFLVGLHWGAVGVAAAYAISEYFVRTPFLYWYMGRISPANIGDFLSLQLPLLFAGALTWLATHFLLRGLWGLQGIPLIVAAISFSYALVLCLSIFHRRGRETLNEALLLAAGVIRYEAFLSRFALYKIKARLFFGIKQKTHDLNSELIISLTSYGPRFATLPPTLQCLLTQSVKPDRIILWISPEDQSLLPPSIKNLEAQGLEIRTFHNVGPYTKIIPTLQTFPDAFVVTADDDIYYPSDWLEKLLSEWSGDRKEIVCHRAHRIKTDSQGKWLPYRQWDYEVAGPIASLDLFGTGVGGIFYPPGVFLPDVLKEDLFLALSPHADDIWLFWMARLAGGRYRKTKGRFKTVTWPLSQKVALNYENVLEDANDIKIKAMGENYGWVPLND